MKKHYIIIFVLAAFFWSSVYGDERDCHVEDAIRLAHKFIERLKTDTPFTYEEERYFFGSVENSYLAIMCAEEFGYLNKGFRLIFYPKIIFPKKTPKYSYLCELIKHHRDDILVKESIGETYSAGRVYVSSDSILEHPDSDLYSIRITYVQYYENEEGNERSRNILISYLPRQKILMLPFTIDGVSLIEKLGVKKEGYSLRLNKDSKTWLNEHFSKLNAQ